MLRKIKCQQHFKHDGFTLIELMIALAINLLILLALTGIYSSNVSHFAQIQQSDALNQQMQSAMQIMVRDIRRAGYWSNAISNISTNQNNNPFMAAGVDITVNAGNNCILFAYDYTNSGSLPSISASSDDDRSGYRLLNQTLQGRPRGATFNCTAAASNWENIINPAIVTITALTFTLNSTIVPVGASTNYMQVRSVDISMTGQLVSNTSITKTLTQHVRIRNDKYVP